MTLRQVLWTYILFVILVVLVVLGVMGIERAFAHSWYDPWCCDDKDCKPLEIDEVTMGPDGFHYKEWVIPYDSDKIRLSQDWKFHACEYPVGQIRCFYVPPGGS